MKHLRWKEPDTLAFIQEILSMGKVILCCTDTVLGLLTLASLRGRKNLDAMKGRSNKPYLILFDQKDSVMQLSENVSLQLESLMKQCWPGPVTLLLKACESIPDYLKSQDNTIAARVPGHQQLRMLLTVTGPLFSTSANKAGNPVPISLHKVDPAIKQACALIVTDNNEQKTVPSTILDCTQEPIKVIREGAFPIDRLERMYGAFFER